MAAIPDRKLDAYLVVAAQGGDAAAFAALVRRWQARLIAHAWRLSGDDEQARDAVQAAWADIVHGLPRLGDAGAFPAWAYRIVSRRVARQIRAARAGRRLAEGLAREPVAETAAPAASRDAERLRAAIRALPAPQRAAIALFYFEDMGVAEVAVALDVPAGTVKTRLMHGRAKLRAALVGDETCATSTA